MRPVAEEAPTRDGRQHAVVVGATSMIGRHLLRRLLERGFTGQCLSRRPSPAPQETPQGFSWRALPGDQALHVPDHADLFSLAPISALPPLIARMTGGRRLVALSTARVTYTASSSDPDERASAEDVRRAEEDVGRLCRERGIAWTILRPTLIYDPGRDRNVSAIAAMARRFGFVPVAWPATGRRQPIHADDVAQVMVAALDATAAADTILGLPGGETLTYRDMVRRIFRSLGRRPILLYLPLGPARVAFRIWLTLTGAPYSTASLERMNMDLAFDAAPTHAILGVTCRPFRPEFSE